MENRDVPRRAQINTSSIFVIYKSLEKISVSQKCEDTLANCQDYVSQCSSDQSVRMNCMQTCGVCTVTTGGTVSSTIGLLDVLFL